MASLAWAYLRAWRHKQRLVIEHGCLLCLMNYMRHLLAIIISPIPLVSAWKPYKSSAVANTPHPLPQCCCLSTQRSLCANTAHNLGFFFLLQHKSSQFFLYPLWRKRYKILIPIGQLFVLINDWKKKSHATKLLSFHWLPVWTSCSHFKKKSHIIGKTMHRSMVMSLWVA